MLKRYRDREEPLYVQTRRQFGVSLYNGGDDELHLVIRRIREISERHMSNKGVELADLYLEEYCATESIVRESIGRI